MTETKTGLDLSQLAAELAVSTGISYAEAICGLLDATGMAARLNAAEAKLAKIRAGLQHRPGRSFDWVRHILDEKAQP